MVCLCPVIYNPRDPTTDFNNLIRDPKYDDALFLFNDNFQDKNCKFPGGNSASIRPYTFLNPPRCMGISTGWSASEGGFQILDENVRQVIFVCFETINLILLENPQIKRIFYSCDSMNKKSLGYAIFRPSSDIIDFITEKLQAIPERAKKDLAISKTVLSLIEDRIEQKRKFHKDPLKTSDITEYVNRFKRRRFVRETEFRL